MFENVENVVIVSVGCEKFISGECCKGKSLKVGLVGNDEEEPIRREPEGLFDGDKDVITIIKDGEEEVEVEVDNRTSRHSPICQTLIKVHTNVFS